MTDRSQYIYESLIKIAKLNLLNTFCKLYRTKGYHIPSRQTLYIFINRCKEGQPTHLMQLDGVYKALQAYSQSEHESLNELISYRSGKQPAS